MADIEVPTTEEIEEALRQHIAGGVASVTADGLSVHAIPSKEVLDYLDRKRRNERGLGRALGKVTVLISPGTGP